MHTPERLFTIAELNYLAAKKESPQDNLDFKLYLTSAVYAWSYLFGNHGEALNEYDPRFRLTVEIYNRSLAKMVTIVRKREIDFPEQTELPWLEGSLPIVGRENFMPWEREKFDVFYSAYEFSSKDTFNYSKAYGIGAPLIMGRKLSLEEASEAKDAFLPRVDQILCCYFGYGTGRVHL